MSGAHDAMVVPGGGRSRRSLSVFSHADRSQAEPRATPTNATTPTAATTGSRRPSVKAMDTRLAHIMTGQGMTPRSHQHSHSLSLSVGGNGGTIGGPFTFSPRARHRGSVSSASGSVGVVSGGSGGGSGSHSPRVSASNSPRPPRPGSASLRTASSPRHARAHSHAYTPRASSTSRYHALAPPSPPQSPPRAVHSAAFLRARARWHRALSLFLEASGGSSVLAQRAAFVSRHPILSRLAPEKQATARRLLRRVSFPRGTHLFRRGDYPFLVYFLLQGTCLVTTSVTLDSSATGDATTKSSSHSEQKDGSDVRTTLDGWYASHKTLPSSSSSGDAPVAASPSLTVPLYLLSAPACLGDEEVTSRAPRRTETVVAQTDVEALVLRRAAFRVLTRGRTARLVSRAANLRATVAHARVEHALRVREAARADAPGPTASRLDLSPFATRALERTHAVRALRRAASDAADRRADEVELVEREMAARAARFHLHLASDGDESLVPPPPPEAAFLAKRRSTRHAAHHSHTRPASFRAAPPPSSSATTNVASTRARTGTGAAAQAPVAAKPVRPSSARPSTSSSSRRGKLATPASEPPSPTSSSSGALIPAIVFPVEPAAPPPPAPELPPRFSPPRTSFERSAHHTSRLRAQATLEASRAVEAARDARERHRRAEDLRSRQSSLAGVAATRPIAQRKGQHAASSAAAGGRTERKGKDGGNGGTTGGLKSDDDGDNDADGDEEEDGIAAAVWHAFPHAYAEAQWHVYAREAEESDRAFSGETTHGGDHALSGLASVRDRLVASELSALSSPASFVGARARPASAPMRRHVGLRGSASVPPPPPPADLPVSASFVGIRTPNAQATGVRPGSAQAAPRVHVARTLNTRLHTPAPIPAHSAEPILRDDPTTVPAANTRPTTHARHTATAGAQLLRHLEGHYLRATDVEPVSHTGKWMFFHAASLPDAMPTKRRVRHPRGWRAFSLPSAARARRLDDELQEALRRPPLAAPYVPPPPPNESLLGAPRDGEDVPVIAIGGAANTIEHWQHLTPRPVHSSSSRVASTLESASVPTSPNGAHTRRLRPASASGSARRMASSSTSSATGLRARHPRHPSLDWVARAYTFRDGHADVERSATAHGLEHTARDWQLDQLATRRRIDTRARPPTTDERWNTTRPVEEGEEKEEDAEAAEEEEEEDEKPNMNNRPRPASAFTMRDLASSPLGAPGEEQEDEVALPESRVRELALRERLVAGLTALLEAELHALDIAIAAPPASTLQPPSPATPRADLPLLAGWESVFGRPVPPAASDVKQERPVSAPSHRGPQTPPSSSPASGFAVHIHRRPAPPLVQSPSTPLPSDDPLARALADALARQQAATALATSVTAAFNEGEGNQEEKENGDQTEESESDDDENDHDRDDSEQEDDQVLPTLGEVREEVELTIEVVSPKSAQPNVIGEVVAHSNGPVAVSTHLLVPEPHEMTEHLDPLENHHHEPTSPAHPSPTARPASARTPVYPIGSASALLASFDPRRAETRAVRSSLADFAARGGGGGGEGGSGSTGTAAVPLSASFAQASSHPYPPRRAASASLSASQTHAYVYGGSRVQHVSEAFRSLASRVPSSLASERGVSSLVSGEARARALFLRLQPFVQKPATGSRAAKAFATARAHEDLAHYQQITTKKR